MSRGRAADPDRAEIGGRILAAAVGASLAVALRMRGRRWWCRCGSPSLWTGDAWGPHNSQHLADPYTFTHVPHGLLLYALLRPLRGRLSAGSRFATAIALEAGWELFENTETVIHHYRKTTAAQGYVGDSVANSLGDVAACAAGYEAASRLPAAASAALFVATEAAALAACRDCFVLNVLTAALPMKAVKRWQSAGRGRRPRPGRSVGQSSPSSFLSEGSTAAAHSS